MSELLKALEKYSGADIKSFGSSPILTDITSNCRLLEECDRPDAYIKINNTVYIIEHFEFDNSKKVRAGSKSRKEVNEAGNKLKALPYTTKSYACDLRSKASGQYYIENAINNFTSHYGNIGAYIKNLESKRIVTPLTSVKIGFFIEDATLLGNLYQLNTDSFPAGPRPLLLPFCKQFLDMFEQCPNLDFCFCASSNPPRHKRIWYIDRSSLRSFRSEQIDIGNIKFIEFSSQIGVFNS